jgi:hypothetical protein
MRDDTARFSTFPAQTWTLRAGERRVVVEER